MPDAETLFFGLVFGAVGIAAFRHGKREGNAMCLLLGVALMVFPYFVDGVVLTVLVGAGLTAGVWFSWNQG